MKYYRTIITYDAMGNPLSYRDGMKMTWQNGRKLTSLKTNDNSITYKYDSNGLRTQKDDKNCTTCYYYDSKNNLIGIHYKLAPVLYFYYDSNGNVTSFSFNDTMYYYVKNLQGDVVKIIDKSGREVVTYTYDAWGKILNQTDSTIYNLANLNPFKYRSYVYDNESGLYYLQSRYYDPVTGRFLNADDTQYIRPNILSCNLYTYCLNNYVNKSDMAGTIGINLNFKTPIIDRFIPREMGNSFKQIAKLQIATAAIIFLNSIQCYVTRDMFVHAMLGEGNDIGPEIKERMAVSMMINKDFMNKVIALALNRTRKTVNWDSHEFKKEYSKDLYYSTQKCQYWAQINYDRGKRYVHVIVKDRFDFTEYRRIYEDHNFSFGNLANDFGLSLQITDLLTPYDWQISFTYYF